MEPCVREMCMIADAPLDGVGNEIVIEIEPLMMGYSGHEDMSKQGVSKATITEKEVSLIQWFLKF